MRRDIGNEVIVAIVAVGALALALTFAIILSLSGRPQSTGTETLAAATAVAQQSNATSTPAIESTPGNQGTDTPTVVVTPAETIDNSTMVPATTSDRAQPSPAPSTSTPEEVVTTSAAVASSPTQTLSAEVTEAIASPTAPPTSTNVPPSPTDKPRAATPTRITQVQPTPTRVPPTATPVPPTATPTRTPTPPTATPQPPTLTPTRTQVLTTATFTRLPTLTPTPISTIRPLTSTPRPTETSGIRPTPTGTLTAVVPIISRGCPIPLGWQSYTVLYGNTLFSIARAVGSTVAELRDANCLLNVDSLLVGDVLYLPSLPVLPVQTSIPQTTSPDIVSALRVEGCNSPTTQIIAPAPGSRLRGLFTVTGTASVDNFQYYKIEIRPDFLPGYNFYDDYQTPVVNGVLGQVNTAQFEPGLHWVRITVVDNTGNFPPPCAVPVIFE